MAKKDDSVAVEVEDPDVVTVEVPIEISDDDKDKTDPVIEPEPKPRQRTVKRVSPDPVDVQVTGPTPDEALAEAKKFAEQAEAGRRAAEATAQAERARADAAEAARQRANKEAEDLHERASNSELALVDNGINAAKQEIEAQTDAYTRAAEAGEFRKMAEIQAKIGKATAILDRLETQKSDIESGVRRTPAHEGRVSAEPAPIVDRTEQFLQQFATSAQTWLRQHRDCLPPAYGGDYTKNNTMMAGHYDALRQNISEGSPDYYRVIEEHLGLRQTAEPEPAPAPAASKAATVVPAARAAPAPAAPPSRDPPTSSGQPVPRSTREVRLTKDQQEAAKITYPHLPEKQAFGLYAKGLLEVEAEGKLGRTTH